MMISERLQIMDQPGGGNAVEKAFSVFTRTVLRYGWIFLGVIFLAFIFQQYRDMQRAIGYENAIDCIDENRDVGFCDKNNQHD